MHTLRTWDTRVLGYSIERIEELNHLGGAAATWYHVYCPYTNVLLGVAADRAEAERIVIARELESARRTIAINGGIAA